MSRRPSRSGGPRVDQDELPSGGFDLRTGGRRGAVRVDLERRAQGAVPEDLHSRGRIDEPLRGERVWRDLAIDRVRRQLLDVDRDELGAETVLEATQLRYAHVQRRLSALEPSGQARAGARELALRPAAGGRSLPGGGATAEPAGGLARSLGRPEVVGPHRLTFPSSMATRCATRRSIPRSAGVSSCETRWPVRRRPSARSVRRAVSFSPIALLCWRISSRLTGRQPLRPAHGAGRARARAC